MWKYRRDIQAYQDWISIPSRLVVFYRIPQPRLLRQIKIKRTSVLLFPSDAFKILSIRLFKAPHL